MNTPDESNVSGQPESTALVRTPQFPKRYAPKQGENEPIDAEFVEIPKKEPHGGLDDGIVNSALVNRSREELFLQFGSLSPLLEKITVVVMTDDTVHLSKTAKERLIEDLRIEADRINNTSASAEKPRSEAGNLELLAHVLKKMQGYDVLSNASKDAIEQQFRVQQNAATLLDQQRSAPGLGGLVGALAVGAMMGVAKHWSGNNLRDFHKNEITRLLDTMTSSSEQFAKESANKDWLRTNGESVCQQINECAQSLGQYMKTAGRHMNTREFKQQINENVTKVQEATKKVGGALSDEKDKELLENIKKLTDNMVANFKKLLSKIGKAVGFSPSSPTPNLTN